MRPVLVGHDYSVHGTGDRAYFGRVALSHETPLSGHPSVANQMGVGSRTYIIGRNGC